MSQNTYPRAAFDVLERQALARLCTRAAAALDGNMQASERSARPDILRQASNFMLEIAEGARLRARYGAGRSASRALAAISLILEAFGALRPMLEGDPNRVAAAFEGTAVQLRAISDQHSPGAIPRELDSTRCFFDELAGWLNACERRRREGPLHYIA